MRYNGYFPKQTFETTVIVVGFTSHYKRKQHNQLTDQPIKYLRGWDSILESSWLLRQSRISRILGTRKIPYRVRISPQLASVLRQMNPVHALRSCSFLLTFLLRLGLKRCLFPSGFLFPYPFLFHSVPCWFDYLNNKFCEQTCTTSKKSSFAHMGRRNKGSYKACSLAQSYIHATLSEWTLLEFNIDSSIVWIHFS